MYINTILLFSDFIICLQQDLSPSHPLTFFQGMLTGPRSLLLFILFAYRFSHYGNYHKMVIRFPGQPELDNGQ